MSDATDTQSDNDPIEIYQFFNEVGIIDQLATAHLEKVLPGGLKKSHFGVLSHMIRLEKRESPAQLASAFQVTRPSMTNTLQKLEAKGLVEIVPNPDDGRGKYALITQSGRETHKLAIEAVVPLMAQLLDTVPMKQIKAAMPLLETVRQYMDENR